MKVSKCHINLLCKCVNKCGKYWANNRYYAVCHMLWVILFVIEDVAVVAAAEVV